MRTFEQWMTKEPACNEAIDLRKIGRQAAIVGGLVGAGFGLGNYTNGAGGAGSAGRGKHLDGLRGIGNAVFVPTAQPKPTVVQKATPAQTPTKPAGPFRQYVQDQPVASPDDEHEDNCVFQAFIPNRKYDSFLKALKQDGGHVHQEQDTGNIRIIWYKNHRKLNF